MIMKQDLRAEKRPLLQFIIEDIVTDGYKMLHFTVFSLRKLQKNPDAAPEQEFTYVGDPADFERTLRDERDQCFLFNLSMQKDVSLVQFDTDRKICIIEVIL